MARTEERLWKFEPSVWRDSALSAIIPPKKTSPNKLLKSSSSILKTNHLSNSNSVSLPQNPSQKYLSELPALNVPSSRNSYPHPKHDLFKRKQLASISVHKKHSSKFKHPRPKITSDREFETAAAKVLAALCMSEEQPSESSRNLTTIRKLELPDGDKRKNMIPKVVLRDIGHIIRKACPKLNVTTKNVKEDKTVHSSLSSHSFQSSSSLEGRETYITHSVDPPGSDLEDDPSEMRCETLLPAISPRYSIPSTPPPTTPQANIFNNVNSEYLRNSRISSSEKSTVPHLPSFDVLGAKAPTFAKAAGPALFSPIAAQPISSAVHTFSYTNVAQSVSASPPLSDIPLSECANIPKEVPVSQKMESSIKPQANKPTCIIRNGFMGFPEEDGRKLRKTRFHVNTNILASSLDLLDLHKNVGVSTGSPYCCSYCNIVFSSVKHCKYHQSVISSDVTDSQVTDVQEDDFWLCPWCPTIALNANYFQSHKGKCREKGRCHKESKASSLRKNASTSSRRRSCKPLSPSTTLHPSPVKINNSYKVFHGQVIPV